MLVRCMHMLMYASADTSAPLFMSPVEASDSIIAVYPSSFLAL